MSPFCEETLPQGFRVLLRAWENLVFRPGFAELLRCTLIIHLPKKPLLPWTVADDAEEKGMARRREEQSGEMDGKLDFGHVDKFPDEGSTT